MANANLNCARAYIWESVVHKIGFNVYHIKYACICSNQARGEYKGQSSAVHVPITLSLIITIYSNKNGIAIIFEHILL